MGGNAVKANALHIIYGCTEADHAFYMRRSRLKLVRQFVVERLFKSDRADHVTAALPGRHGFQQFPLAVEDANSGGPVNLVTGKSIKITIERLNVNSKMRGRLRAIHQHRHIEAMRHLNHLAHRIHCAQGVGNVRNGDQLGFRTKQLLEFIQQQFARIIDRNNPQPGALLLA